MPEPHTPGPGAAERSATLHHDHGRHVVRFERHLPHPVELVWQALTEADHLAAWFPTTISGRLVAGGALRFEFRDGAGGGEWDFDGQVLEVDPPRLLAFRWGDDVLRAELTPTDAGCLLVFTDTMADEGTAARDAAGWHVCLDQLEAHTDGRPAVAPGTGPTTGWQAHFDRYAATFGPAASAVRAGP
ncbi:hypothetical protein BH10ACT1_BH10ACT1_39850 [soil metagenome]